MRLEDYNFVSFIADGSGWGFHREYGTASVWHDLGLPCATFA